MAIFQNLIEKIFNLSALNAFILFLVMNIGILLFALILGRILKSMFDSRTVIHKNDKGDLKELILAGSTVLLNALVTLLGWYMWKRHIIVIQDYMNYKVLIDFIVLFMLMDYLMFMLHWLAHNKFIYKLIHKDHHNYINPKPITLFALNPLENLSFGIIWLILITVYDASWFAIGMYLTVNLLYGIISHSGVEAMPKAMTTNWLLKYFTTSTFHAHHHSDINYNFGFYTTIWDRIFRTISPYYKSHFGKEAPYIVK